MRGRARAVAGLVAIERSPRCLRGTQVPVLPTSHACVPTLSDSFVMNRTSGDPFEKLMCVSKQLATGCGLLVNNPGLVLLWWRRGSHACGPAVCGTRTGMTRL